MHCLVCFLLRILIDDVLSISLINHFRNLRTVHQILHDCLLLLLELLLDQLLEGLSWQSTVFVFLFIFLYLLMLLLVFLLRIDLLGI